MAANAVRNRPVGTRVFRDFHRAVCVPTHRKIHILSTQADSALSALGKSLDGVGFIPPSGFQHGDTATHTMMNTNPANVRADDVYFHHGIYRTVCLRTRLKTGGIRLDFVAQDGAVSYVNIAAAVYGVTVYRPKVAGA